MPNPFSDFWDFLIGNTDDHNFLGPWKYLFVALFLAIISVLPDFLIRWFNVPFYFGGTSLLIVVGVALDTVRQMESHLLMRNYEGFLRRSKSRPTGAFGRRS